MSVLREYAIREVALATFYSLENDKPLVFLENLKTSGLENTGETVYARGGRGNPKIVGFSGNREGTVTLEDAVFTNEVLAMMTGNDLITGTQDIYKREILVVADGLKVTLNHTPVGDPIKVAEYLANKADGTEYDKDSTLGAGKYTLTGKEIAFNTGDVVVGDRIVVYYKTATGNESTKITVTANKFAGSFKVVLDCLVRSTLNGRDYAAQIVIYNAKMEDNWGMAFANEGDPAVLNIPLEMLKSPVGEDVWDMTIYNEDDVD